jgi:hypothetical protein
MAPAVVPGLPVFTSPNRRCPPRCENFLDDPPVTLQSRHAGLRLMEAASNRSLFRRLLPCAALFFLVILTHTFSPNATPFDSRWTVPTALSLVHSHNADRDEYLPMLERDHFYAIECVEPGGKRTMPVSSARNAHRDISTATARSEARS